MQLTALSGIPIKYSIGTFIKSAERIMKIGSIISIIITNFALSRALLCWTCENQPSNEACQRLGKIQSCLFNEEACENEVRRGSHGNLITKRCKQAHACNNNFLQNERSAWHPTQCNTRVPSSVCKCCCSSDGCNAPALACMEDIALENPPECIQVDVPKHGQRNCKPEFHAQTAVLGTICLFSCNEGYRLDGKAISECVRSKDVNENNAEFTNPPPTCKRKACPELVLDSNNGFKSCTDENYLGSICEFGCDEYHTRVGPLYSSCVEFEEKVEWNNKPPTCEPNRCSEQMLRHGEVICDDPDLDVDTICRFECVEPGYILHPPELTTNLCLNDTSWNISAPCCTKECPVNKVDFVVILDSSSSVGSENWVIMKRFVRAILESFDIGSNKANLGVFRYNNEVDSESQILLGDYADDKEGLLAAFDKIPYNGLGTRTGQALAHARDILFAEENGNRPDATDILLIITDGRAQDDVALISRLLRRDGVIIFVLGIIPPQGQLDIQQLLEIAGDRDNVIIATGGFEDLATSFAQPVSDQLCGIPCQD